MISFGYHTISPSIPPIFPSKDGVRTVSHLPGGEYCVECYLVSKDSYNKCESCKKLNYELKTADMSYGKFCQQAGEEMLQKLFSKIPETYQEFCDLYEVYEDLPELIEYDDDDFENAFTESDFKEIEDILADEKKEE